MNFILSESQLRLEQRLFAQIKQHIAAGGGYLLLLVPAQASFLMERRIVEQCSSAGFMSVEVMSFEKLAERILKTAGGRSDTVMDGVGLAMLVKKAMKSLGSLRSIDSDQRDIHQKAAELISAIKAENISPAALRTIGEAQRPSTRDKLLDLADLYEYIAAHAASPDLRDMEQRAIERVGRASFLQGAKIAVYGFDTFTALRIDMLRALLSLCASMDIYLELEEENPLYANQVFFLRQLVEMAAGLREPVRKTILPAGAFSSPELGHLFQCVFAYGGHTFQGPAPAIRIGRAATRQEELAWVAEQILRLMAQGVRPREIGVMSGQPTAYENELRDVFARAGIPYFYDGKRSLGESRLAEFVLSAVDILESGWRLDHVLRHMKTHLLPIERREAEALARFARERRLFGSSFRTGLKNCDDALEDARRRGFSPLAAMAQQARETGNLALALADYLEALGIPARLEQEAEALHAAGFGDEALFTRQLFEKTRSVLAQAAQLGAGMKAADLRDMLACGLEAAQVAIIPPSVDEVAVGDITHSIFPHKRAIFILGANDGSLPPLPDYSGLLGQTETEEIKAVFPSFPDKPSYDSQKPFIRRCLCGGDALFLSYTDREKNPSYVVDKILRTFPEVQEEPCGEAVIPSEQGGLESLAADLRNLCEESGAPLKILGAYLQSSSPYPERLLRWALDTNAPTPLSPATAKRLYGDLRGSASLVEGYYRCPYQSFLDRGIRPAAPENGAPDQRIAGVYAHRLLESFSDGLNADGRQWASLSPEEIDELLARASQGLAEDIPQFSSRRFQYHEQRIRREVSASCKAIQRQLEGTACNAASAVEQPFGYHGELKIKTPLGDISLVGKIDRIDTVEEGGQRYVRIIDYKTGPAAFSPRRFAAGIGLQLVIYLMAAAVLFREAKPAGAFYFHVSYPVLKAGEEEKTRLEKYVMEGIAAEDYHALSAFTAENADCRSMKISMARQEGQLVVKAGENTYTQEQLSQLLELAEEIVKDAALSIYAGSNAIAPLAGDDDPCPSCPYGPVCRFDGIFSGNQRRIVPDCKKSDLLRMAEERSSHGTDT